MHIYFYMESLFTQQAQKADAALNLGESNGSVCHVS